MATIAFAAGSRCFVSLLYPPLMNETKNHGINLRVNAAQSRRRRKDSEIAWLRLVRLLKE